MKVVIKVVVVWDIFIWIRNGFTRYLLNECSLKWPKVKMGVVLYTMEAFWLDGVRLEVNDVIGYRVSQSRLKWAGNMGHGLPSSVPDPGQIRARMGFYLCIIMLSQLLFCCTTSGVGQQCMWVMCVLCVTILVDQNVDVKSVVSVIRALNNIGAVDWSAMGRAILALKETLRL